MAKTVTAKAVNNTSNDAKDDIQARMPYFVEILVQGVAAFLFHRWSVDAVESKANAKKGSAEKKSDNTESYLYRDEQGRICIPSEYFRQSIIHSAKFQQDPRSPRKSAMDLFKAGLATMEELCAVNVKDPQFSETDGGKKIQQADYMDRRRVVVQRAGITRCRPALYAGWEAKVTFNVLLPEYISPEFLQAVTVDAGRIIGVGDFRPSYGRFAVMGFKKIDLK